MPIVLAGWLCLGAVAGWPDVPTSHWARSGVMALADRGLLVGRSDGRFDGEGLLTRYELAALLARVLPLRPPHATPRPPLVVAWHDVPAQHWAASSLTWLTAGLGLLGEWPGLTGGYFSGDKPASRYELVTALATLLPPGDETGEGEPVPSWVGTALQRVVRHGVCVGFPDGRFHGERPVSRYEAALAFYKALALPEAEAEPTLPATTDPGTAPGPAVLTDPPIDPPPGPEGVPTGPPTANLPRLAISFLPEYLSEMADATKGEATGWALASSGLQADWADGPLVVSGSWRVAQYGLRQNGGTWQSRWDQQLTAAAGYRWQFGKGRHDGELALLALGAYLGRRAAGSPDDLLGMDLQAFGLGAGVQWRWPVAYRLVAHARGDVLPVMGAQFGPPGGISGQLGLVQATVGLDWYLDRLSVGVGYRLRHLYDGQQQFSHWANGLQVKAALAF